MNMPSDSGKTVVPISTNGPSSPAAPKDAPRPSMEHGLRREIPVHQLAPDELQPRKAFDAEKIRSLAENIREFGLINPIVVRRVPTQVQNGAEVPWRIISGERRWRAVQSLGWVTVDVIVRASNDREAAAIGLIENTCREGLNLIEVAMGIRRLQAEFGYTQVEIAPMIQVGDRTRVSKLAAVLDLPEVLHGHMQTGELTASHAEILLRLPPTEAASLGLQCVTEGWSSRRLAVATDLATGKRKLPTKPPGGRAVPADVQRLQTRLGDHLCTPVSIKAGRKSKGDLVIHYANHDVLQGILERLGYKED